MSKSVYLFILFLTFFNFWGLKIFAFVDVFQGFLPFIWMFFGVIYYRNGDFMNLRKFHCYTKWIFFGVLTAFISCWVFWGQGILQSIITSRTIFLFSLLSVLLYIGPTQDDIFKVVKWVTLLLLPLSLLKTFYLDSLFTLSIDLEDSQIEMLRAVKNGEGESYILSVGGGFMAILYFSILLVRLDKKFSLRNFSFCLVIFTYFLLVQNRSTIIGISIIMIIAFLSIKSINKLTKYLLLTFVIVFFTYYFSNDIIGLVKETQEQLNDSDYNRNLAYACFFTQYSPNWACYIFGNAVLSSHTSGIREQLMTIGVFNSDVGFIGFWNEYGLITLGTIISIIILPFKNKNIPKYLKYISIYYLLTSPTTAYFGTQGNIFSFCIYGYLIFYNIQKIEYEERMLSIRKK